MNKTYIKDMSLISPGLIVLALLLIFISVPTTARSQTEETNALVETWLLKNCDAMVHNFKVGDPDTDLHGLAVGFTRDGHDAGHSLRLHVISASVLVRARLPIT